MLDQTSTPNLQTPPPLGHDEKAFLGENWFFYWKLGPGLWRTKIEEYTRPGPLLVPINWSFHTDTGEQFDFAVHRPETNLKKLVDEAHQVGRHLTFFLPLTPVPFLPNGGIPHLLAGNLAQDSRGIAYGILDGENNINKLYSFFDTKVFQSYARFTRELGRYFIRSGIDTHIWGMECGYSGHNGFESFLSDTSPAWQKSFHKFVKTRQQESLTQEQLRYEFQQLIRDTYCNQAAKDLKANWEGVIKVGFIGGHPHNIFEQLEEKKSPANHSEQTLNMLTIADLPSSILINNKWKRKGLRKMLDDIVVNETIRQFQQSDTPPDWQSGLSPLRFFEIHHSPLLGKKNIPQWNNLHLQGYLQKFYRWTSKENWEFQTEEKESETDHSNIHFFQGHDLTTEKFRSIVRLLMNEQNIILDQTGIQEECARKMELFFLENDLPIEKINLHTNIRHIKMNRTHLIIFDGLQLTKVSTGNIYDFWHRLIGIFSLRHLEPPHSSEIEHYWRTRLPAPEELNYEEIRRLSVYNTGSSKKRLELPLPTNFKLLRLIDQIHSNVQSGSRQITVELDPEGSISMDFGVFT